MVRHGCTHLYLHQKRVILPIHAYGIDSLDWILSFSDLLSHILDTVGSNMRDTMVNIIRTWLGILPSTTASRDRKHGGRMDTRRIQSYRGSSHHGQSNNNNNNSERLKLSDLDKIQHIVYTINDYFTSIGLPYEWDHFIYDRNPKRGWRPVVGYIVATQCYWCNVNKIKVTTRACYIILKVLD